MNPESVALRFDPVTLPLAGIQGTRPVVIVTEQDMAGAGRGPLSSNAMPQAMANGREAPSLGHVSFGSGLRHPNRAPERIGKLVVVLDSSGSMGEQTGGAHRETKLEHVQAKIRELGRGVLPADLPVSLVVFNSDAQEVWASSPSDGRRLHEMVSQVAVTGGTCFEKALILTSSIVRSTLLPGADPERTAVLFVTDGQDGGTSRQRTPAIARQLRDLNTGCYLVGVGADYDQQNILDLSSHFGYSGWAHTPMPAGNNVFGLLLPGFLNDMQSCEHYLRVLVEGSVSQYFGITPAVRMVDDRLLRVGYQREGMGIVFEEHDDLRLRLHLGRHAIDRDHGTREIPILDIDDAGMHYEKIRNGKAALDTLLLFLAQLGRNIPALEQMKRDLPDRSGQIDEMLELSRMDQDDPDTRMGTLATASELGSAYTSMSFSRPVNAWSRIGGVPATPEGEQTGAGMQDRTIATGRAQIRGDDSGDASAASRAANEDASREAPELHSGVLGRLDATPAGTVPPVQRLDANAYRNAVPIEHAAVTFFSDDREGATVSLESLVDGGVMTIGRGKSNDIRLRNQRSSRPHCRIRRIGDGFVIEDLESANGTFRNGVMISGPIPLHDGDEIRFCKSDAAPVERLVYRARNRNNE